MADRSEQDPDAADSDPEWERRRRRARVFGEGLPDTTSDERDDAADRGDRDSANEAWLRSQVPPHHG